MVFGLSDSWSNTSLWYNFYRKQSTPHSSGGNDAEDNDGRKQIGVMRDKDNKLVPVYEDQG